MATIVFDALGTLFDRGAAERALTAAGAPPVSLEAWFQRILHEAATLTIIGEYRPFQELARAALRTTLAQLGLDPSNAAPLDALQELDAYPDAAEALAAADGPAVLTNGSRDSTRSLLDRSGLGGLVETILSCDDVRAFKPGAAPYGYARRELGDDCVLVAAHGWDVLGARAAGLAGVWVDRAERAWPFPLAEPPRATGLVEAVAVARSL
jgi:2-haloacid dehalogenase